MATDKDINVPIDKTDYISREAEQAILCDDCRNKNCPMQSGIKRSSCALYKAPTKTGYIRLEDAIEQFQKQYDLLSDDYYTPHRSGIADCIEILKDIPAADVRPVVRGKWVTYRPDCRPVCNWKCSACSYDFGFGVQPNWNFCPNCGADMREVDADGES